MAPPTIWASGNDRGEAGTGDDKTDIVIIAIFYNRAAIYSRDRFLSSNANALAFGGFDNRSSNLPGGPVLKASA